MAFRTIHKMNGRNVGFLNPSPDKENVSIHQQIDVFSEEWVSWLLQPAENLEILSHEAATHKRAILAREKTQKYQQEQILAQKAYSFESAYLNFLALANLFGGVVYFLATDRMLLSLLANPFTIIAMIYFGIGQLVKRGVTWLHPISLLLIMLEGMALVVSAAEVGSDFIFWSTVLIVGFLWIGRFASFDKFVFKRRLKLEYDARSWFGVGLLLYVVVVLTSLLLR